MDVTGSIPDVMRVEDIRFLRRGEVLVSDETLTFACICIESKIHVHTLIKFIVEIVYL